MRLFPLFYKYIISPFLFYFRHSPLELRYAKISVSQCGEDIFIDQYFKGKQKGFYIDVGAYHPFNFSNTYLFYKKGWNGINIEPNPYAFNLLDKYRKRDKNIAVAVSNDTKQCTFLDDRTYSCIVEDGEEKNASKRYIQVQAEPLSSILKRELNPKTEIDFMSVDCEGHDLTVLQTNDWSCYRPQLVLVEDHDESSSSAIDQFMASVGYHFMCRLGLSKAYKNKGSI